MNTLLSHCEMLDDFHSEVAVRNSKYSWFVVASFLLAALAALYVYTSRLDEQQIRISSNPWVGFTPFIYAQEKGWLKDTRFKFVWVVDLTENSRLYERGFTQGFTATQYEMLHFKDYSRLRPVFLIDRSFGADAILSNVSLDDLRKVKKPISVYLELGSLNEDFFRAFVREYDLGELKFNLINSSQKMMERIDSKSSPMIIISYAPYVSELTKQGFFTVASTQTLQSFSVVDALFVDEQAISDSEAEYKILHDIFNRAYERLEANPREYYEVIKGYLEGQSYDEFMGTTTQIHWLAKEDATPYIRQLQGQGIKTGRLLP